MAESIEERLDFLESEQIAAGDVAGDISDVSEALQLIHAILVDLTDKTADPSQFSDDLDRIDALARGL